MLSHKVSSRRMRIGVREISKGQEIQGMARGKSSKATRAPNAAQSNRAQDLKKMAAKTSKGGRELKKEKKSMRSHRGKN